MAIRDTDSFLINKGTIDYSVKASVYKDRTVRTSDYFLINRNGTDYKLPANNLEKVRDNDLALVNRSGTDYKVLGSILKDYLTPPFEWDVLPNIKPKSDYLELIRTVKGGKPPYAFSDKWEKYLNKKIENWVAHSTSYGSYYGSQPLQTISLGGVDYMVGSKNYCSYSTDGLSFTLFKNSPGYAADVPNFSTVYSHFVKGNKLYLCTDQGIIYGNKTTQWKSFQITNLDRWNNTMTIKSLCYDSTNTDGNYIAVGYTFIRASTSNVQEFQTQTIAIIKGYDVKKVYSIQPKVTTQNEAGTGDFINKDSSNRYVMFLTNQNGSYSGVFRFTESQLNAFTDQNWNTGSNVTGKKVSGVPIMGKYSEGFFSVNGNKIGFLAYDAFSSGTGVFCVWDGTSVKEEMSGAVLADITDSEIGFCLTQSKLVFGEGTNAKGWVESMRFPTPTKGAIVALTPTRITVLGDSNGWLGSTATGYTAPITSGWFEFTYTQDLTKSLTKYRVDCTAVDAERQSLNAKTGEYNKTS